MKEEGPLHFPLIKRLCPEELEPVRAKNEFVFGQRAQIREYTVEETILHFDRIQIGFAGLVEELPLEKSNRVEPGSIIQAYNATVNSLSRVLKLSLPGEILYEPTKNQQILPQAPDTEK